MSTETPTAPQSGPNPAASPEEREGYKGSEALAREVATRSKPRLTYAGEVAATLEDTQARLSMPATDTVPVLTRLAHVEQAQLDLAARLDVLLKAVQDSHADIQTVAAHVGVTL